MGEAECEESPERRRALGSQAYADVADLLGPLRLWFSGSKSDSEDPRKKAFGACGPKRLFGETCAKSINTLKRKHLPKSSAKTGRP